LKEIMWGFKKDTKINMLYCPSCDTDKTCVISDNGGVVTCINCGKTIKLTIFKSGGDSGVRRN